MSSSRFLLLLLAALIPASDGLAQRSVSGLVRPASESSVGTRQVAPNALAWQAGPSQSTFGPDCFDFNSGGYLNGFIVTSWVAYYGDPNASPPSPKAGDVYYAYVFFGNASACQFPSAQPFLILPANTTLAISQSNPVRCFRNGVQTTPCSQNPQLATSLSGATGYNLGLWSELRGLGPVEIQIPLTSSTSGFKTLAARIDTAGGGNGWITPSVSILVGAAAPTVSYPTPSATLITNTTARTTADVFNQFLGGTFFFDIGTTTSYGTSTAGNAVSSAGNGFQYYSDWSGLNPGTLYHWRGRFVHGGGTVLGANQTFTTTGTVTVPATPLYVSAAPLSPTQVSVTWEGVVGTTSYQIWRRGPNLASSFAQVGTTTLTSYTDSTALANSAYQYRVRAVNAAGSSPDSQADLVTTVIYSDDRLVGSVTPIKAAHLIELRTAVTALRTLAGQGPGVYTDTAAPGLTIKAVHILELRTQYDQAMGVITGTNSSWATTPYAGGSITFVDFQQLRDRLK